QRVSLGLLLDVIGGAVDAHLHPQVLASNSNRNPDLNPNLKQGETMTLAMFARCAAGGPKLSPEERRFASTLAIVSALAMASLYLVLTKIFRQAPAVQAVIYTSVIFTSSIQTQMSYLRNRSRAAQALILGAELGAMYLFMLSACLIASRL
ncbi:MAG: hypothetical protein ABSF53_18590, partial [Terracidiphilus sp.]